MIWQLANQQNFVRNYHEKIALSFDAGGMVLRNTASLVTRELAIGYQIAKSEDYQIVYNVTIAIHVDQ